MSTRTVRLDDESEQVLHNLVRNTGLTISAVFKRGLLALEQQLDREASRSPYQIYEDLDLGKGGYAVAPSTETRRGVAEAIRRKLGR